MNLNRTHSLLLPLFTLVPLLAAELTSPTAPFIPESGKQAETMPTEFRNEGIYKGSKSLTWVNGQPHASLIFSQDNNTVLELHCRVSPTVPGWAPFTRFQDRVNSARKSITRTHQFQITKDMSGEFVQNIALKPDGKIHIDLNWNCDLSKLKSRTVDLFVPLHSIAGKQLKLNGKLIHLPQKKDWLLKNGKTENWINSQFTAKLKRIEFFPDAAGNAFALELDGSTDLILFRSPKGAHFHLRMRDKTASALKLVLDPGKSTKLSAGDNIVNGINFTRNNAFTVSLFDKERNFFLNPSFESGTRYFLVRNVDLKTWITTREAHSGKYSMLLHGTVETFSFPIRQRQDYTLSFYAKSTDGSPKTLSLRYYSYENTQETQRNHYFTVKGTDWKRYEVPFNIPRSAVRFSFRAENIYLDDLQLEPGKKASPYAGNRLGLEIRTDSRDHDVVNADETINAKLLVRGPVGTKGTLHLTVYDFFKRITVQRTIPFAIPGSGETLLTIADDSAFPLGTNILRVDAAPEGLPAYTDFLRVTRMKYADNTSKNKDLHGTSYYGHNYIRPFNPPDKELRLLKAGGIGAHSYLSNHTDPNTLTILNRYGMKNFGNYIERGPYDRQKRQWSYPVNEAIAGLSGGKTARELTHFSPEILKAVENAAFKIAKAHPHITYWTAHTEPSGAYESIKSGNIREYAKYILALNRGIMKANPAVVFNPMGDCGMNKSGRDNIFSFLKCANELEPQTRFKVIDIHTYRQFPELPDTEFDLKAFMDGLDKLGYRDIPVHLGEGAYWVPVIVNEWLGIAPWQDTTTKDRYGMHLPSYDLGWGEQVSAAMILRYWLVAYKYMDRVKFTCPWVNPFLDDTLPFAWLCMSSNLTDLLGNAVFRQDIRFASGARAYLFEDEQNRPVAAYWFFEEELDRGLKKGHNIKLDLRGMNLEFIDLMGNNCTVRKENGKTVLPLSNFPVFIRGRKGEMKQLANAFLNADIPDATKPPVELLSSGIDKKNRLKFDVVNQLSRPLKLSLKIASDDEQKLNLAPNERKPIVYTQNSELHFDRINEIEIPVSVGFNGQQIQTRFKLAVLPLKKVSDNVNWDQIPAIPLHHIQSTQYAKTNGIRWNGPTDLSGTWQAAWSKRGLHFRFNIRDNDFVMDHTTKRGIEGWYDNDTVQLFIDTLGDGRANAKRGNPGFDQNDYSYELLPTGENTATVFRRHAPDQQLTGGLDGLFANMEEKAVHCKFNRNEKLLTYEVFFPARFLQPMEFTPGSMPGIGIKVFDRDGNDRSARQVLSNVEGDVFRRTDIYTQLLFTE